MQKNEKKYHRLPGKKRRLVGKNTLWAGPDHILSIESSGVSESYRRFYYNDIKSIVIAKTHKATIESFILGAAIIFLTAFALRLSGSFSSPVPIAGALAAPFAVLLWIIDSILFIYFFKNIFYGSSCECFIETAAQQEKLTSVNRLKVANKFMKALKPLVEKEQGVLSGETLLNLNRYSPFDNDKITTDNTNIKAGPVSTGNKNLFILLYALITIIGMHCIITLYYRNIFTILMETFIFLSISALSIIAIIRQHGSTLQKPLKFLNWTALCFVIIRFIHGYIEYFMVLLKNAHKAYIMYNNWQLFEAYTKINPFNYPLMLGMKIFIIASFLIIGLSGLILLRKQE